MRMHCNSPLSKKDKRTRERNISSVIFGKHWIPYDWMFSEVWRSKNMADYPEDEIGCNLCDMAMKANDFCSRGERKDT